jgi:hypothetical protein
MLASRRRSYAGAQLLLSEHKSNAENADYRSHYIGANASPEKPDISTGSRRSILMRNIILVAVAALGLSAAIAPMASAASADQQGGFTQGGPYARISNGPGNLVTRAN